MLEQTLNTPSYLHFCGFWVGFLKGLKRNQRQLSFIIPTQTSNMKRAGTEPNPEVVKKLKESQAVYLWSILECAVCNTVPKDSMDSDCCLEGGHFVCRKCMNKWSHETGRTGRELDCPICRREWKSAKNQFRQLYLECHYQINKAKCDHDPCEFWDWELWATQP